MTGLLIYNNIFIVSLEKWIINITVNQFEI